MSNTVKDTFDKHFNGYRNFITPKIHSYGQSESGQFYYEISYGDGIYRDYIAGVTVLEMPTPGENDLTEPTTRHDLSDCFQNRRLVGAIMAAELYVTYLFEEGGIAIEEAKYAA